MWEVIVTQVHRNLLGEQVGGQTVTGLVGGVHVRSQLLLRVCEREKVC